MSIFGGGGSGAVVPKDPVTIYEALVNRLGSPDSLVIDKGSTASSAADAAKSADVAIVVLAQTSHEGADRTSINLNINGANSGDDVVSAVGAAQPNTVVVTISPGPFLTNW